MKLGRTKLQDGRNRTKIGHVLKHKKTERGDTKIKETTVKKNQTYQGRHAFKSLLRVKG